MADWQMGDIQQLLQVSDEDIERRKRFVGLQPADEARITSVGAIVVDRADELCTLFIEFLKGLGESTNLFQRGPLLEEIRRLKRDHLVALVGGKYDRYYVDQRLRLGFLYGKIGLDARVFLGAFHHLIHAVGNAIMASCGDDPQTAFESFMSIEKVFFFDIGLIIDIMAAERERTISAQQEAIRELSTPVLQVRDRLLILPIIGALDTRRAKQLTDSLLQAIRANRAKVVVIDVTGVLSVDSRVANHLIQTVASARLMGASVIVTGLSADAAQSLVGLGVDLRSLNTVGDLQGGLEDAERLLGYSIVRKSEDHAEAV